MLWLRSEGSWALTSRKRLEPAVTHQENDYIADILEAFNLCYYNQIHGQPLDRFGPKMDIARDLASIYQICTEHKSELQLLSTKEVGWRNVDFDRETWSRSAAACVTCSVPPKKMLHWANACFSEHANVQPCVDTQPMKRFQRSKGYAVQIWC